jgi:hypothetical protein
MHAFLDWLLRIVERVRSFRILQLFTIGTRYLIGGGFVMAAFNMGKFAGPWTPGFSQEQLDFFARNGIEVPPIGDLDPFLQFWRVMGTSGMYWKFIGATQVLAGAMLMTQRFAKLGAAMFLGIILNIFVLTVAYGFEGTPLITGLMLLAAIYLIVWDLDSFQYLLRPPARALQIAPESGWIAKRYWGRLGAVMMTAVIVQYLLRIGFVVQLFTALVIGVVGILAFSASLAFLGRQDREGRA